MWNHSIPTLYFVRVDSLCDLCYTEMVSNIPAWIEIDVLVGQGKEKPWTNPYKA